MTRSMRRFLPLAMIAAVSIAAPAAAQTVFARLSGYGEVPVSSSPGSGELRLKIDRDAGSIYYELEFGGLQGNVTQAHIHFGQHSVNGGISVWLCGTATNPGPAGTPVCPSPGGIVTGTLMAGNVVGPVAQLIDPGEFDELVNAIHAGVTYANVHSSLLPGGEIRGQIGKGAAGGQH